MFGWRVYKSALTDKVAKTGDIPMPSWRERVMGAEGGHAIMAVGYDDTKEVILFRNSWSDKWGQAGYGTLPYTYFNGSLSADLWCIQGTESDLYAMYKKSSDNVIA